MTTREQKIMDMAREITEKDILVHADSTIKILKDAHYQGLDVDDVVNIEELEEKEYEKFEEDNKEVMQYWIVSEWLGEKLAKEGAIVVSYDNFYYLWGRTGYGYAMEDDFMTIAEDVIKYRENLK